jgi:hypothetical protein
MRALFPLPRAGEGQGEGAAMRVAPAVEKRYAPPSPQPSPTSAEHVPHLVLDTATDSPYPFFDAGGGP